MSVSKLDCPRCGTPNDPGGGRVIFCVSCGELIDVAKTQARQESKAPEPAVTEEPTKAVLIAAEPEQAEVLPERWQDASTQVPLDGRSNSAVNVDDLVFDLDLEPEPPSVPPPLPPDRPASQHQDQDATLLLVTPTPYQKAQAVSNAQTNQDFFQAPALPPRSDSIPTNVGLTNNEVPPSEPLSVAPVKPEPLQEQASEVLVTEKSAASLNEVVEDPAALFDDLDDQTQSSVLSVPPPPVETQSTPIATPAPNPVPSRPVTEAPFEGEDPFMNLAIEGTQPDIKNSVPKVPPPPVVDNPFDDLAAYSAQIKASEKRARTEKNIATEAAPKPAPAEAPPVRKPAPSPAQVVSSNTRPSTRASTATETRSRTNIDGSNHGLKIDFVSSKGQSVEPPVVTALPDIRSAPLEASRPITGNAGQLRPKSELPQATAEPTPEDLALNAIARPAIVVPLSDPNMESIVHQMAVSMTGTVKKTRVNSKKSLVVSGLLLTQAKLLREKLRAKNIHCTIVDPASIQTGFVLASFVPDLSGSASLMGKATVAVLILCLVFLGLSFGMDQWEHYKLDRALRASVIEVRTKSLAMKKQTKKVKKVATNPVRTDLVPYEETRYGGRNAQWWQKRISKLRLQERSAPSSERADIRIRLLDTERKARALGLNLR